jgi:DNA-binding NarL/FixJ family response regulator
LETENERAIYEREKAILILAQQGKSSGEIANDLCKEENTKRNQIKPLFSKLNVHSMQEAIEFACHHRMIYTKQDIELQPIEMPCKRSRVLLTKDMLQRIQQYLDDGKSTQQAARLEGISEHAIRYWKNKKMKLVKRP